jgi:RimJ/RimL family protein N-acetyltransferase
MQVLCKEPEGDIVRTVYRCPFTREAVARLYDKAKNFPVLFGRPLNDANDFMAHFVSETTTGEIEPQGIVWIIDDFVGMFYMNEISDIEATAHYSFFDRRHKGREPLVRAMVKHLFDAYGFVRVNAYIPAQAGMGTRLFIERCGFKMEGRKRRASWWKGKWFDVYLYGILPEDVSDGS